MKTIPINLKCVSEGRNLGVIIIVYLNWEKQCTEALNKAKKNVWNDKTKLRVTYAFRCRPTNSRLCHLCDIYQTPATWMNLLIFTQLSPKAAT